MRRYWSYINCHLELFVRDTYVSTALAIRLVGRAAAPMTEPPRRLMMGPTQQNHDRPRVMWANGPDRILSSLLLKR